MLPAARAIPVNTTTTDFVIASGLTLITGWSWIETTGGATAELQLFDGSSETGALVADIALNAGESTRDLLPEPFLACMSGLFLEIISGSVRGSVWTIEATLINGYAFAEGARGFWTAEL